MKRNFILAVAIFLLGMTCTAQAQNGGNKDYYAYPHTYIGIQGGAHTTLTDYDALKLISPIGAFSIGHNFSPILGARLQAVGWKNMGGIKALNKTYSYDNVTAGLDLMFNISNIVAPTKHSHLFNAVLFGGFGANLAWNNDELNDIRSQGYSLPIPAVDDRLPHYLRLGMQFGFNVAKHLDLNLEVAATNTHDRFGTKYIGMGDWQISAMAGLAIKFGYKKRKTPDMTVAMGQDDLNSGRASDAGAAKTPEAPKVVEKPAAPKPAPAPAPAPKVLAETRADIFFLINSSSVRPSEEAKIKELAEWLKAHPQAKVVMLTGYADAGTGNANVNMKVSQKRVNSVVEKLVNEYGVDASRINQNAKGDSVQPFTDNDSNRVVIITAKEEK